MEFRELSSKLYSEREYDTKSVEEDKLGVLMSRGQNIEKFSELNNLRFKLFRNGDDIYKALYGAGGYSGVMIKSPHYIGIVTGDDKPKTRIITGYAGQALIKEAFEIGLSTCWVDLENISREIEDALSGSKEKRMEYAIALGYPKEGKDSYSKLVTSGIAESSSYPFEVNIPEEGDKSGGRLSVTEIVYIDEWGKNIDFDDLEKRGLVDLFYYVKNAPSNKNKQPWRFIIKDGEILLTILNPNQRQNFTDAGIIMFMLEGLAYEMGIPGKWLYLDPEIKNHNGEEYAIVGKFGA